ncbi:MAG: hypothetical protein AB1791_21380, partial [Chloroflexota bacterium]
DVAAPSPQGPGQTPNPLFTFAGISYTGSVPPDTIGDVGPDHYVQAVNVKFAIWDKSGVQLKAPTNINTLGSGFGGVCQTHNDGDPVVLYDSLADRWVVAQFALAAQNYICVAVSQTADPLGAYHRYAFQTVGFPDYPKLAVWGDAYYASTNENGASAYAFERADMLNGQPASSVRFNVANSNFMLPADVDGSTAPPTGAPNPFYTFTDSSYWGGANDRLEIYEFHVDWTTPANSTFTNVTDLTLTPFTYTVCGYFNFSCIRQPSPGERLDAISEWPMHRWAYRNFGTHQSLVGNFAFDVNNNNRSGIRWYELRKTTGAWALYQEGTHSPNNLARWVGSIAMDGDGNIALGYSVSSRQLRPAIRYATRLTTDPLGTLQAEASLIEGTGVQRFSSNRWGDYSAMGVDPADDCTFWYTNEYYVSNGTNWQTRIGAFVLPECAP